MPFQLRVLWGFWFAVLWSTIINVYTIWLIPSDSVWDLYYDLTNGALALLFGLGAWRVSLRLMRGPREPTQKPLKQYILTTLLAMLLAWFIHVFGMVCAFADMPRVAVLLLFFVPTWLLFLAIMPTNAKFARWENRGIG